MLNLKTNNRRGIHVLLSWLSGRRGLTIRVSAFTARASSKGGPVSHNNIEQTYCKQCEQLANSSMLVQKNFELLSIIVISMISESLNNFNRPLRSNLS